MTSSSQGPASLPRHGQVIVGMMWVVAKDKAVEKGTRKVEVTICHAMLLAVVQ